MKIFTERPTDKIWSPNWIWFDIVTRYNFAAQFVEGKVVVDCGCGNGIGSERFLRAGAGKLYGFDIHPGSVEEAKARCRRFSNAEFRVAHGSKLGLPDGIADTFVSLETIEHIDDDRAFLSEIKRVLRPGGILVCTTPNRRVMNPGKTIHGRPWNKYHIREYAPAEFVERLNGVFSSVELWGHNRNSLKKIKWLGWLGEMAPLNLAARINQALKIPRIFYDELDNHAVERSSSRWEHEYLVAICRKHDPV